jgi:hypothetical protein
MDQALTGRRTAREFPFPIRSGGVFTAVLAGCSFCLAGASFGQTGNEPPIENVLVVAQKRGVEENAQSVPRAWRICTRATLPT